MSPQRWYPNICSNAIGGDSPRRVMFGRWKSGQTCWSFQMSWATGQPEMDVQRNGAYWNSSIVYFPHKKYGILICIFFTGHVVAPLKRKQLSHSCRRVGYASALWWQPNTNVEVQSNPMGRWSAIIFKHTKIRIPKTVLCSIVWSHSYTVH